MILRTIVRLHRNERGAMSLVSVFTLLLLMFLLGMVMNSTMQVDQRVKMQNAADAVTYSGSLVVTRNLNTIAFTNHLLADVFALTAFMREARDRKAEKLTAEILDNWERIGHVLRGSEFPPFDRLGTAIGEKIPPDRALAGDRDMVFRYSEWAAAGSELMLPVFESMLRERMIPNFQRALVTATPELMQTAADDIARRHSDAWPQDVRLYGVMWRTNGEEVSDDSNQRLRVMPVVDTVLDAQLHPEYRRRAERMRFKYAHRYLRRWDAVAMNVFDRIGQMSQFGNLWRIITCGELKQLLEEYPDSNLPMVLRHHRGVRNSVVELTRDRLERDFMFVGMVYRPQRTNWITGIFENPNTHAVTAYAEAFTFVPRRRLVYRNARTPSVQAQHTGIPGQDVPLPSNDTSPPPDVESPLRRVVRQSSAWFRESWSMENQNWTLQLSPATCRMLPQILSTTPYELDGTVTLPELGQLNSDDVQWLSHH